MPMLLQPRRFREALQKDASGETDAATATARRRPNPSRYPLVIAVPPYATCDPENVAAPKSCQPHFPLPQVLPAS